MRFEMVYPDERKPARVRQAFGEGQSDKKRSDETRPVGNGYPVQFSQAGPGLFETLRVNAMYALEVFA